MTWPPPKPNIPRTWVMKHKHKAIFVCARCKKRVPWRDLALAEVLPDKSKARYPWCKWCEVKRLRRRRLKKYLLSIGQEKALARLEYQKELVKLFKELYKTLYGGKPCAKE